MGSLWRLIFSATMLAAAAVLGLLAYVAYDQQSVIGASICGALAAVAVLYAWRGPKHRAATGSRRRRKLVDFDDIDPLLYERAQAISAKAIDGPPTKYQLQLAKSIGIALPAHVSAGTAMEILDDAIRF